MPATKERKASAAAAELVQASASSQAAEYEQYREQLAAKYAHERAVLDAIVSENESLEVCDLALSVGEMLVCETVCERDSAIGSASLHEVSSMLKAHRELNALRDKFGDPAILAAAKDRLAAAVRVEQETAATLEDIDVMGPTPNDPSPALARQIDALSKKLTALIAAREGAEAEVRQIENARAVLRNKAPAWLKQLCEREVNAARRRLPCFRELARVDSEIERLSGFLDFMHSERMPGYRPGFVTLKNSVELAANVARVFVPDAITPAREANKPPTVDFDRLVKFVDTDAPQLLAELEAARAPLAAECAEVLIQIEAPLDRFCAEGVV